VKTLSMRPYPGNVHIAATRKEYQAKHKEMFGHKDEGLTKSNSGRMTGRTLEPKGVEYLVWGAAPCYLAHEIAHVILNSFESTGINPCAAGGEPFCYMLSQLLLEAWE